MDMVNKYINIVIAVVFAIVIAAAIVVMFYVGYGAYACGIFGILIISALFIKRSNIQLSYLLAYTALSMIYGVAYNVVCEAEPSLPGIYYMITLLSVIGCMVYSCKAYINTEISISESQHYLSFKLSEIIANTCLYVIGLITYILLIDSRMLAFQYVQVYIMMYCFGLVAVVFIKYNNIRKRRLFLYSYSIILDSFVVVIYGVRDNKRNAFVVVPIILLTKILVMAFMERRVKEKCDE